MSSSVSFIVAVFCWRLLCFDFLHLQPRLWDVISNFDELTLFLAHETDSIVFILRFVQCQLLGQPMRECCVLNALQSAHRGLMTKGTGPATGLCVRREYAGRG